MKSRPRGLENHSHMMHYTNNKIIFETIDNTFIAADQNIEKYLVL